MEKGRIVFLNGVTSSGKTSIIDALRSKGQIDFYYLSDDIFEDHIIDIEYKSPEYWNNLSDAVFLMYKTAKLFSDHGKTVIIDSMIIETSEFSPHYSKILDIFKDNPLSIIKIYCPLEICRQRNLHRNDREEYQSHEQAAVMAQGIIYDLELDTSNLSANQCADIIINQFIKGE